MLSLCLLAATLQAHGWQPVGFGEEPPVIGQPAHFSGAVGPSFQVSLRANPPEVRAGESFTVTVRVIAAGPWHRPPTRLKLEEVQGFAERFRIDRSKSNRPDREMPTPRLPWTSDRRQRPPRPIHIRETPAEQRSWEFDYRLTPLNDTVDEIPAVPFAYYRPPRSEGLPGSFPTAFADPIPLKVLPREKVQLPPVKIDAPPGILQIVSGSELERHEGLFRLPALPGLLIVMLLPPLIGIGWYVVWQRQYPDAARQAKRRQSRAPKAALQDLHKVKGTTLDQARQVAQILAEYLRDRYGLSGLEPTPTEVSRFLPSVGVQPEQAHRAARLFQNCDAARFAPESPAPMDWSALACDLIVDLEAESVAAGAASAKPPSEDTDA